MLEPKKGKDIAYKKDDIYFSEYDQCLTNEWGNKEHGWYDCVEEGIRVDEYFELDETKPILLETHEFDANPSDKFYDIKEVAFQKLGYIKFADKNELQEVIDSLVRAKTYMK